MRINRVCSVTLLTSLCCTGTAAIAQGVAITLDEAALWEGTWLTVDSWLEENVYHMLRITRADTLSLTYVLEDRQVPYGPNAEWSYGRAEFRDAIEAVDSETGRTLRLRVDPGDRDSRVILLGGDSFLLQRSGGDATELGAHATPIEEAGAFLDAMHACISNNFDSIVGSFGDTAPDMAVLGASCGLDRGSLSELADALVQDALLSHVLSDALVIAFDDLQGDAAVRMLMDALAAAADDVNGLETRGRLEQASEREVLEAFFHATGGPDWQFRSGWLSDLPLAAWSGVVTNDEGRVAVLGKANARARGPIPPELGQLSALQTLMLSFNEFSGPIPPEIGGLTDLKRLLLGNNGLSGSIPVELRALTELTELSLDGDTGLCLPEEIRHTRFGQMAIGNYVPLCTSLASDRDALEALYRAMGGYLRPIRWFSDEPLSAWSGVSTNALERVERLDTIPFRLDGPIPAEIGQLTSLISLALALGASPGPIPPEIGRLSNLVRLVLVGTGSGGLSGSIPPELGELINLQDLTLVHNQLSGPIPVELGELSNLRSLSLDGDTGLCLPAQLRDTAFGELAMDMVPRCGSQDDDTTGNSPSSTRSGSDFSGGIGNLHGSEPAVAETESQPAMTRVDEHGDSPRDASLIDIDSETPGVLTDGDVDYFRIELDAAAELQIWTLGEVDTVGQLEAGDGSVLAGDDDSGLGTNFELSERIQAGTVYVRVTGFSGLDTGDYSLNARLVEDAPPVHGITWFAEHVNEDGNLERWQMILDEGDGALRGTSKVWFSESTEDRTVIVAGEATAVSGTYVYPDVVLRWMIVITDERDETYACSFSGVMERGGEAIVGAVVCEGDASVLRQLRFERTYG